MVTAATRGACDDTADRPGRPPGRKAALENATEASNIKARISTAWKAALQNSSPKSRRQRQPEKWSEARNGHLGEM
jgi:hypothetical protein